MADWVARYYCLYWTRAADTRRSPGSGERLLKELGTGDYKMDQH